MEARRLGDGPSVAPGPVNQVRDTVVSEEVDRRFPPYAVAGESGIGLAELDPGAG